MTALLAQVLQRASHLPESLQDEIARELLEELNWEEESINTTAIDALAEQALNEYHAGKTVEQGWENL